MRSIPIAMKYAIGAFVFTIVTAHADQAFLMNRHKKFEVSYDAQPGTPSESHEFLRVDRTLKFYFYNSGQDRSTKGIARDEDAIIREYMPADIENARSQAWAEAKQALREEDREDDDELLNKVFSDKFQEKVEGLRFKEIDCRLVAKAMVEALIGHFVQDDPGRTYVNRRDLLDPPLVLKNLSRINIVRGQPSFTCQPTEADDGGLARCGNLTVFYQPHVVSRGLFKDQKVTLFDPARCVDKGDLMDFRACELRSQVNGCGLQAVEKARGQGKANLDSQGLADVLEDYKNQDLKQIETLGTAALALGGGKTRPIVRISDVERGEGLPPAGFEKEFITPRSAESAR